MADFDLDLALKSMGACEPARLWAQKRTPRDAWMSCERADWMLWTCEKAGVDKRRLIEASADCAELAWEYCSDEETLTACMLTVHVAREFVAGRADEDDCAAAAHYADYAADASYATDAVSSAAAYSASSAAYAATIASSCAADAAYYAACAAADYATSRAASDAERQEMNRRCADAVRARIPFLMVMKAMRRWHG